MFAVGLVQLLVVAAVLFTLTESLGTDDDLTAKQNKNGYPARRPFRRVRETIMSGYDIYSGNPHTNATDPGFRGRIFREVYNKPNIKQVISTNGFFRYKVPKGFNSSKMNAINCTYQPLPTELFGPRSYQRVLWLDAMPTFGHQYDELMFVNSTLYHALQNDLNSEDVMTIVSVGQCLLFKLENTFDLQPSQRSWNVVLKRAFKNAVKKLLNNRRNGRENYTVNDEYINFFHKYGSHVVSVAYMGARADVYDRFQARNWANLTDRDFDIHRYTSAAFKVRFVGAYGTKKSERRMASEYYYYRSSSVMNFATYPPRRGGVRDKWANYTAKRPTLVKYELKPMSFLLRQKYLFTDSHFGQYTDSDFTNLGADYEVAIMNYANDYFSSERTVVDPVRYERTAVKFNNEVAFAQCRNGYHLLSCGLQNTTMLRSDFLSRHAFPVNSTYCRCYNLGAGVCVAWCASNVTGFEVVEKDMLVRVANTDVTCPSGKTVVDCNVRAASDGGNMMQDKQYGVIRKPNVCSCNNNDGQTSGICIATCIGGVADLNIRQARTPRNSSVEIYCNKGNVLGCTMDSRRGEYSSAYPNICRCRDPMRVSTCRAVCGRIVPSQY